MTAGVNSDEMAAPSRQCSAALTRAFGFLGKRWNGIILATLSYGPSGFAELRRNIDGISDSVLSERLNELQKTGLVVRRVEPGPPVSVSYALTEIGGRLMPALDELSAWSTQNLLADHCPDDH